MLNVLMAFLIRNNENHVIFRLDAVSYDKEIKLPHTLLEQKKHPKTRVRWKNIWKQTLLVRNNMWIIKQKGAEVSGEQSYYPGNKRVSVLRKYLLSPGHRKSKTFIHITFAFHFSVVVSKLLSFRSLLTIYKYYCKDFLIYGGIFVNIIYHFKWYCFT